jgi:hypothetical protein
MVCVAVIAIYGTLPRPQAEADVVECEVSLIGVEPDMWEVVDVSGHWQHPTKVLGPDDVFADNFDTVPHDDELDEVLDAIRIVENRAGDPEAVGDKHLKHKAYGLYQIRQPYLDDVNEIAGPDKMLETWGKSKLTTEDVKDEVVARWAARLYLEHYGRAYTKKTGKQPSKEVYARMHNGGPNGWKRTATNDYFAKVMKELR